MTMLHKPSINSKMAAGGALASLLLTLSVSGCASSITADKATVKFESPYTSSLTDNDRLLFTENICPVAEVLPVDVAMLQMARDVAENTNSPVETDYIGTPLIALKNVYDNSDNWSLIRYKANALSGFQDLKDSIAIAAESWNSSKFYAIQLVSSWERGESGQSDAEQLTDLISKTTGARQLVSAVCGDLEQIVE